MSIQIEREREYCAHLNPGGGCGGLAWPRVLVGAVLGTI